MKNPLRKLPLLLFFLFAIIFFANKNAQAHCDTMEGPVITAAREALDSGNVNLVLIWVQEKDEKEIIEAFQKALVVRNLSEEAKELADMYFFETLVRIHRAGEGAPYTGLKTENSEKEPFITFVDNAIENDSLELLFDFLENSMETGIKEHFQDVMEKKDFNKDDVAAGREYVVTYVEFLHYIEAIYENSVKSVHSHDSQKEDL